jgi:hypothetical protein
MVRSSRPASLSVSWSEGLTQVEFEGGAAGANLALRLSNKPGKIELNGSPGSGWTYDQGSQELRLAIPEGQVSQDWYSSLLGDTARIWGTRRSFFCNVLELVSEWFTDTRTNPGKSGGT